MKDVEKYLDRKIEEGVFEGRKTCIYGTRANMMHIHDYLEEKSVHTFCFIDDDSSKYGNGYLICPVVNPSCLNEHIEDYVVVIYSIPKNEMSMRQHLIDIGFKDEQLCIIPFRNWMESFRRQSRYEKAMRSFDKGKRIYNEIKKEGERLLLLTTQSIGDTFQIMTYFDALKKAFCVHDYVIVFAGRGNESVMELFDEKRYRVVDYADINALRHFICIMGEKTLDANIVYPWVSHVRDLFRLHVKRGISWAEGVKKWVCFDDGTVVPREACYESVEDTYWDNLGLTKLRTVILAPYVKSADPVPMAFWRILSERLQKAGYVVATNVAGKEKAIDGTIGVNIPLRFLKSCLKYSGFIITYRSGLSDVVSSIPDCRHIVLMPDRGVLNGNVVNFWENEMLPDKYNNIRYIGIDNKKTDELLDEIIQGVSK